MKNTNKNTINENITKKLKESFTEKELKKYGERIKGLLENPFSEKGREIMEIIELGETTKEEENYIELGELLGIQRSKLINSVNKDREELQIKEMLKNLGIGKKEQEVAFA
ncbi:MAG: hypothetical protein PHN31_05855 [Candidatus Gracilibacteria bacterium]|nr:hypothetical protein [Candidatus Gracilibacteria bacterium]